MKIKLNHPRSIIFKWLISYVLILIIPLVIFLIVMFRFVNVLDGEINYSNTLLLKQLQMQIDNVLYDAKELCAEISIDPNLQQLSDDANNVSAYDLSQIVYNLGQRAVIKNQPVEFYAYYFQRDLIINNSLYCDRQFFYDTYLYDTDIDSNQWNKMITSRYSTTTFATFNYMDANHEASSKIVMITPLTIYHGGESYGYVAVVFNGTELVAKGMALQGLKRENVMILNSDNKVLFNSLARPLPDTSWKYDALQNDTDEAFSNLSNGDDVVSYISSKEVKWKYIIAVPKKAYQSKMIYVRNCMIAGLLLCFVIGGFSIVMMLRNNYGPVSKIMKAAKKYTDDPAKTPDTRNEFQYISNVIDEIQNEKLSIASVLQSQKEKMRSQILLQLLENKDLAEKLTIQDLERNDILFQSDCFFVLLYAIRDYSQLFGQQNETLDDIEKYKLSSLVIRNVTEELLNEQQMKTFFFHTSKIIGFIVNHEETDEKKAMSVITDQVEKANLFFDKN